MMDVERQLRVNKSSRPRSNRRGSKTLECKCVNMCVHIQGPILKQACLWKTESLSSVCLLLWISDLHVGIYPEL